MVSCKTFLYLYNTLFQVAFFESEETFKCGCLLFEHYGILCRHILCVMKKSFMKHIPTKYLIRRWKKDIIHPEELQKNISIGDSSGGCNNLIQESYSLLADCINMVGHDAQAMAQLIEWQKEMKSKIQANPPDKDSRSKRERLAAAIGVSIPDEVVIRNPSNIRNKGCGMGKRIKGKREIAMETAGIEGRFCNFCKKKVAPSEKHDKRNCPERKALEKQKELEEHEVSEDDVSEDDDSE